MRLSLKLMPRDTEIFVMLSLRVRFATLRQIAQTWWLNGEDALEPSEQRLLRWETTGMLQRRHITARLVAPLVAPLAQWLPQQPTPNLGSLAWQLHQRWNVKLCPIKIYCATPRCAQYFGGRRPTGVSRPFQVSHDLGVTEMFLAVRRLRPELASEWIDEDRLAPTRRGEKLPDAVIASQPAAIPRLVLEFGGHYPKSRLQAFHDDCEERGLPYEIW